MISQKLHSKIAAAVTFLQQYTDRIWYTPLIGLLAALDNLLVVIPNDGILISSTMLIPKRWFFFAFSVSVGSTLGALCLAEVVKFHGLPWVLDVYPGLSSSQTWTWTVHFFELYGLLVVFVIAMTPLFQQPAIIMAALAATPIEKLAVVVFTGRFIKFLIMAYIASHAPRLLKKMWGIQGELKDVGLNLKS